MNISINDGSFCTPPRRISSQNQEDQQEVHDDLEATTPNIKQEVSPQPPPRLLRLLAGSHNTNTYHNDIIDSSAIINEGDSIPLLPRASPPNNQQKNTQDVREVEEGDIHTLLKRLNDMQQQDDNYQQQKQQQQKGEQTMLTKQKQKIDPDGSKISRRNSIQLNDNNNIDGEIPSQSTSSSSGSSSSKIRKKKSKKKKNDGNRSIQSDISGRNSHHNSCSNSSSSSTSSRSFTPSTFNNGSISSTTSSTATILSAKDEYQLQKIRLARLLGSPEGRGRRLITRSQQKSLSSNKEQYHHEYAMSIHPESIQGTCEAAAWHLHGQTGGRKSQQRGGGGQSRSNRRQQDDSTLAVMDARALMNGLTKDDNVNKSFDDHQIMTYKQGKDTTNVKMDIENNELSAITRDTHPTTYHQEQHNDQWSTGLAASIVTGTASRYYKSFFNFPHGRKILLPIVIGTLGTLLSFIPLTSCQFMTIVPKSMAETIDDVEEEENGGYVPNQIYQVGPWKYLSVNPTYSDGEVCLPYPSNMIMDVPFMISRIVSATSSVCGCILVLWSCTLMCIPARKASMNGLGLCFLLLGIVELMTVLFYQGTICNNGKVSATTAATVSYFGGGECNPNQDLIYCIASCILFVATGWILYILSSSSSLQHNLLPGETGGESSMEVHTWSSESTSSNPKRGIIRTIEKSWMKIPDGSTVMATVFVEQQQQQSITSGGVDDFIERGGLGSSGGKIKMKTTYSIQTEILPA